jgi:hypothetical protein
MAGQAMAGATAGQQSAVLHLQEARARQAGTQWSSRALARSPHAAMMAAALSDTTQNTGSLDSGYATHHIADGQQMTEYRAHKHPLHHS